MPFVLSVNEAMGIIPTEGAPGAKDGCVEGEKLGTFAAMRAAEAEKAKCKRIELMPLAMEADAAKVGSSLWGMQVPEHVPITSLFEDLEEEFLKEVKKKVAKVMRRASISKMVAKKEDLAKTPGAAGGAIDFNEKVVDPRRATNLAIMLSKFGKITCAQIAASILNFDVSLVGAAELLVVQENLPTVDEVGLSEMGL